VSNLDSSIQMYNAVPLNQRVGRRMAAFRRRAKLTQAEMAARIGWSRDSYANYEYGRHRLALDRLAQIAQALGVPLAALLVESDDLATIITQLIDQPALIEHVSFFLGSMADEIPPPPSE
jgi:transcriptional regulator with XRE-family HTH domain